MKSIVSALKRYKPAHCLHSGALRERINHSEKKTFFAKKGDVFIWNANLIHDGSPIKDYSLTRKSMGVHYYAKDVIKYHEITERPSLMETQFQFSIFPFMCNAIA